MSNVPTSLIKLDNLQVPTSQVVLVYTQWNQAIIDALREGAKEILAAFPQVTIAEIQVPGAVEIPFIIQQHYKLKANQEPTAYIALGCVIKGDTPHFDYVCDSVTQGITQLNTTLDAPTIFGVLTVLSEQQAWDRLGGSHGHKGQEAAAAALHLLALQNSFIS